MIIRTAFFLTAVLLAWSPPAAAEVRYVRAGDDLQAALNAARPGDELRLEPEAIFTGNFVLPVTTGTSPIIVRTDLPDDKLPGTRQRVTPATASRFGCRCSARASEHHLSVGSGVQYSLRLIGRPPPLALVVEVARYLCHELRLVEAPLGVVIEDCDEEVAGK